MNFAFLMTAAIGQIITVDPICPPAPVCPPPIRVYVEPQVYVRNILIPGEVIESEYTEWIGYTNGYEKVTIINGMAPSIRTRYDSYGNKWITYDYRSQIDVRDCDVMRRPKKVIPKAKYEEDVDKPRIPTNNDDISIYKNQRDKNVSEAPGNPISTQPLKRSQKTLKPENQDTDKSNLKRPSEI